MRAHNTEETNTLSIREKARLFGVSTRTITRRRTAIKKAVAKATQTKPRIRVQALSIAIPKIVQQPRKPERPLLGGSLVGPEGRLKKATGRRWVITSSQNNTKVSDAFYCALIGFWGNNGAELLVSGFSYNANAFENPHRLTKESEELCCDEPVQSHLVTGPMRLAKDLVFCAELDILPTAVWIRYPGWIRIRNHLRELSHMPRSL